MFKFSAIFALIAAASAYYVPTTNYHVVSLHPVEYVKHEPKAESWSEPKSDWEEKEEEKPANYEYTYEVHDSHTGDIKSLSETASHGVVKGQYSLIDSDGYKRIVDYTADDHHGFQATVKREPTHFKIPIPAPKIEEPKGHDWW